MQVRIVTPKLSHDYSMFVTNSDAIVVKVMTTELNYPIPP